MLQIIKFIKVNVLEKYFFKKLTDSREKQLKIKMRVNISFTGTIFTYFLCSPMIIASTLLVYIALGNEITASKAFFTILIFKILQFPMY